MEALIKRIRIDPNLCNRKPVIRGMRITVKTILAYIAAGETAENILKANPLFEPDNIKACLEYAKRVADKSRISYDHKAS